MTKYNRSCSLCSVATPESHHGNKTKRFVSGKDTIPSALLLACHHHHGIGAHLRANLGVWIPVSVYGVVDSCYVGSAHRLHAAIGVRHPSWEQAFRKAWDDRFRILVPLAV